MTDTQTTTQHGPPTDLFDRYFRAMVENAPINMMVAAPDLTLVYMNEASRRTLRRLQHLLPAPVDSLIGRSLDIFHRDPSYQRRILSNPSSLPRQAVIELGDEKLDLSVSALNDTDGSLLGFMASWSVVTEKVRLEQEAERLSAMVDNAPINMMFADPDLKLTYLNPASIKTLTGLSHLLPVPANKLVGQSIDIFHKDPAHQRALLANPEVNLPRQAVISLGEEKLDLLVSPIRDKAGTYIGAMATWSVITQQLRIEQQVAETAKTVAGAATEFSAIASELGNSASTTVVQATQAASASDEVSQSLATVASASEQMSASIQEISRGAAEAARVAAEAVAMAAATNDTVASLGEASMEIGEVVKSITSIAKQTNLLALNATIEAARAGEAGKGFAVVANEVKELARQTAVATDDITAKIDSIQRSTMAAVDAINGIGTVISTINENVTSIASAVEEQTATTNEITRSVSGAASGATQIATNVSDVASRADATMRAAEETKKTSGELLQLAVQLEGLVQK